MRIVYLHQYFNTPEMSGGTRSYEMARRLVAQGHDVHMVTSWRENDGRRSWFETQEAGINVHWLPVPYSNHMSYGERIRAFIRFAIAAARRAARLPVDVVFATSTPLTIALPGAYSAFRRKIPMVFEVRDSWPEVPIAVGALRNPLTIASARLLERFAYRQAARVVALAPGMKDGVCATGYPADRVDIIPNGADIESFQSVTSGGDLHQNYSWIDDGPIIVYVGTIGPANGVDYIPWLAAAIRSQNENSAVRFAVLGDGRSECEVKDLARELGVLDRSVFFVGKVPKRDVPAWLSASAATIMTYDGPEVLYRDSVSNKFFDSLAAGRPVFSNFRGFSANVAERYGAGEVLPKEDVGLAARLLAERLGDGEWLRLASDQALELGRKFFDRNFLAQNLEKVLLRATGHVQETGQSAIGAEYENLGDEGGVA